jgi:uncharacterized protein
MTSTLGRSLGLTSSDTGLRGSRLRQSRMSSARARSGLLNSIATMSVISRACWPGFLSHLSGTARSTRCRVQLYTVIFDWDPKKSASNARKHGIRFADALPALEDDRAVTIREDSDSEERWVTIGMDAVGRILVVVYTWRGDDIRVISVRAATQSESRHYMENL